MSLKKVFKPIYSTHTTIYLPSIQIIGKVDILAVYFSVREMKYIIIVYGVLFYKLYI